MLQTRDGYLWVGTHNGVARFDGMNFTNFNRGNTPQLPANDTRELYESRDGTLWIGSNGGLVRYRPGCPGTFEQVTELEGNGVKAVFEDRSGAIWVGTREKTWRASPGQRARRVVSGLHSSFLLAGACDGGHWTTRNCVLPVASDVPPIQAWNKPGSTVSLPSAP